MLLYINSVRSLGGQLMHCCSKRRKCAHLIWSENLSSNFTLLQVGKVWKSLVTIFNFGICHSPFFVLSILKNGLSLKVCISLSFF